MAPTPKRSLKRTVAGTVEERSPRFLLSSLALAMVISLVAGLAIGIKVEQHRGKTKKAKPVAVAKKKKPVKAKGSGTGPLFGNVVQSKPKFLVITARGRRVVILVVPKTRIEVTAAATSSDIKAGSRVRFALKPTTTGTTTTAPTPTTSGASSTTRTVTKKTLTATKILILTAKTGVGTLVSSVTSDSMTLRIRAGKFVTISTTGAKIRKTTPGQKAQITKGRRVLVKTFLAPAPKQKAKPKAKGKGKAKAKRVVKRRPIALEIVVLPVGFAIG